MLEGSTGGPAVSGEAARLAVRGRPGAGVVQVSAPTRSP